MYGIITIPASMKTKWQQSNLISLVNHCERFAQIPIHATPALLATLCTLESADNAIIRAKHEQSRELHVHHVLVGIIYQVPHAWLIEALVIGHKPKTRHVNHVMPVDKIAMDLLVATVLYEIQAATQFENRTPRTVLAKHVILVDHLAMEFTVTNVTRETRVDTYSPKQIIPAKLHA